MVEFCKHDFIRKKELYRYYDIEGIEVIVFQCQCSKCGKLKRKKFIGHIVGNLFDNGGIL